MQLSEYPRPDRDNGWGIHLSPGWYPLGDNYGYIPQFLDELDAMGFRWLKIVSTDDSGLEVARQAIERGFEVVLRMYRERPNPGTLTEKQQWTIGEFSKMGGHYVETNNEPNLLIWEWDEGYIEKMGGKAWFQGSGPVAQVVNDWIRDAEFCLMSGILPGFPAMSPGAGDGTNREGIDMLAACLDELKARECGDLFENGAWLACHNAGLNHPIKYPDDLVNRMEWATYFDYPDTLIHEHHYRNSAPTGFSNGWRQYEAIEKLFVDRFGFRVPVLGTEGGFWVGQGPDPRYSAITVQSQGDLTLQVMRMMRDAPAYFFCTGHWCLGNRLFGNQHEGFERDAWWRIPGYGSCPADEPDRLPICQLLKDEPKFVREFDWGQEPKPPPPPDESEFLIRLREEAWRQADIDWNEEAALARYAREHSLGVPMTQEYIFEHGGIEYVAQGFSGAIVYCPIGAWDKVRHTTW